MSESLRCVVILCTVPSAEVGDALARKLVEARHAACVNRLGPLRSTYRWQGAIHVDEEHQLLIKTTREAVDRVRDLVRSEHPYEVPELIALDADVLTEPYAAWLRAQVD
jgi:periplasmic divalent cation tolerance protein